MALHEERTIEGTRGFAKVLNSKSTSILMDLTQEDQYQYPVQSVIRELSSNAVDATTEKLNALKIKAGEAQISDFYIDKEGEVYEDSRFNADYYNPEHLDSETKVRIEFEQRDSTHQRDLLRIIDHGVGLGDKRLELYFEVGGSSKRLNSNTLGKFGLGAKSPLALDVASFRMSTVHNGRRFVFDIFSKKIIPALGKFTDDGQIRPHVIFGNEEQTKVYYELTSDKNGTTVEVEVKKIWRTEVLNAVRNQLLYMPSVEFWMKYEHFDHAEQQTFLAKVLYEDEFIVISDNNQFSQPHIVLDNGQSKICYGKIDWTQLELEQKQGNIGLKFDASELNIHPSREYVIWKSKTREAILKRFEQAQQVATTMVQAELKETDTLRWIQKAATIWNQVASTTVLGRLSRIVSKDSLTPTFAGSKIKFQELSKMLYGVQIRSVSPNGSRQVNRSEISSWTQVNFEALYIADSSASQLKDVYLCQKHGHFTMLTLPEAPISFAPVGEDSEDAPAIDTPSVASAAYNRKMEVINWLLEGTTQAHTYEDVEIPLEVEEALSKQITASDTEAFALLLPSEQRRLQGKVFVRFPNLNMNGDLYGWNSAEPTVKELQSLDSPIVYGFQEDDEMLKFVSKLVHIQSTGGNGYSSLGLDSPKLTVLKLSKELAKKLPTSAQHVTSFNFQPSLNKTGGLDLALHPMIQPWFTARRIQTLLSDLGFMRGFSSFNLEMFQLYEELREYTQKNKVNFAHKEQELETSLAETADKLAIFEDFLVDHQADTEAIAAEATKVFGNASIQGVTVWEPGMKAKYEKLDLYTKPLRPFFNHIQPLTYNQTSILVEIEQDIKALMQSRGVQHD